MTDAMRELTEREKETLRLLLAGHDAKSIARELGLSVHTVNDRLRDARRKLGVSSSREAARLLNRAEGGTPQIPPEILAPTGLGIATEQPADADRPAPGRWRSGDRPLFWLGGGMLIMSFIILAAMLSPGFHGADGPRAISAPAATQAPAPAMSAAAVSAMSWLALLDRQSWDDSWNAAGSFFRSRVTKPGWTATIQPLRQPLGAITTRRLQSTTRASSLPGAPPGDYEIVMFATDFATRPGSIETVVMAREGSGWTVNGYFIR
jgi:DNA-binding CsgD family transcriptional regulator